MNTTKYQLDEVTQQLEETFGKFESEFDRQTGAKLRWVDRMTGWIRTGPIVLRTSPGSGKTKHAIELVNRLADKGIYAAYFVLSHNIAEDMKEKSEGEMDHWGHWKAHRKLCTKAASKHHLQQKGYQVSFSCDCKWREQFRTDRPTIMPMDYSLASDVDSVVYGIPENTEPLRTEINEFAIRIFDEIDFSRFVGDMDTNRQEIDTTAQTHPIDEVRAISKIVVTALDSMSAGDHLNGAELINKLSAVKGVNKLMVDLSEMRAGISRTPWYESTDQPSNFPPLLVPLLTDEYSDVKNDRPFNPRIHLIKTESESNLVLRWRKKAPVDIPVLFMDASADEKLLSKVFGGFRSSDIVDWKVEIPGNVTIKQYPAGRVGMRTLNISPYDKGIESRSTQHNWIRQDLEDVEKSASVGIVTFKDLENEFKELVEGLRYSDVRTAHYGNLRSLNDLEDSDVLILMGCPTPGDEDIVPEAQAFFYDEPLLATGWNRCFEEQWNLEAGGKLSVKMGSYEDDNLNRYQVQKVEWELYQALHRSRPIRVCKDDKQLVLVYTNVPIPETKVSMGTGRWGKAVEGIQAVLGENEKCTPPKAALAAPWLDVKAESQAKWIRQHPYELAALASVKFDGKNFRTKP